MTLMSFDLAASTKNSLGGESMPKGKMYDEKPDF
jgi:hypothetical protein